MVSFNISMQNVYKQQQGKTENIMLYVTNLAGCWMQFR